MVYNAIRIYYASGESNVNDSARTNHTTTIILFASLTTFGYCNPFFIIYPLQSRLWDIAGSLSRLHLRHPTKEFVHIFRVIQESRSKLQEMVFGGWCMGIGKCWSCCWGFLLVVVVVVGGGGGGGGGGFLLTLGLPKLTGWQVLKMPTYTHPDCTTNTYQLYQFTLPTLDHSAIEANESLCEVA